MVTIQTFVIGPLQTNCYVIQENSKAIIIDPGFEEAVGIAQELNKKGISTKYILITHSHFDHVGWAQEVRDLTGAEIVMHKKSKDILDVFLQVGQEWGLKMGAIKRATMYATEGDTFTIGTTKLELIHTPGHSPDGLCFYLRDQGTLFSGDTLFQFSVGRTDLPFGDWNELEESIKNKLYTLPENTKVLPGHGPTTQIGIEKKNNPFVNDK